MPHLLAAITPLHLMLFIMLGGLFLVLLPSVFLLIRGLKRMKQQEQRLDMKCHHCGYDRIGHLQSTICPECGGALDDFAGRYGLNASRDRPVEGNRNAGDGVS